MTTCVRCGRTWTPTRNDPVFAFGSGERCVACANEIFARIAATFDNASYEYAGERR